MRATIGLLFIMLTVSSVMMTYSHAMSETTQPPLRIAISGSKGSSNSVSNIVAMVRTLGAEPVFLSNHQELIDRYGAGDASKAASEALTDFGISGVIVMGNDDDIDPAKYGEAKHPKTNIEQDAARADFEDALINQSLESKVPLLGICAGMQRLNVLGGGSLHQHVPDITGDEDNMQASIPGFIATQFIEFDKDSKLGKMAGDLPGMFTPARKPLPQGVVMENSFHHQSVNRVAEGFKAVARSDGGIVEAIEPKQGSRYEGQFVMGVQWHPEFGASPLSPKLVGTLVENAKDYALKHALKSIRDALTNNVTSSLNVIKTDPTRPSELLGGQSWVERLNQQKSQPQQSYGIAP